MHATDVIGYTADADYWCKECAALTYDRIVDGVLRTVADERPQFSAVDFEGNDVHPIFASDEMPAGAICNRCKSELTEPCDCSDEYGPCEAHGVTLVQREGASTRTADDLLVTFLEDARDIDPSCLAPYGLDVLARARQNLNDNESLGVAWFSNDEEGAALHDEVRSVVDQVESHLDAVTYWEDGYRIVRMSEDCPLWNG